MFPRVLAAAAAVWVGFYLVAYLVVVGAPTDFALVYAGLLVFAAAVSGAAVTHPHRPVFVAALVTVGTAMVLGLLTMGAVLIPAVVALVVALAVLVPPGDRPRRKPGERPGKSVDPVQSPTYR
ncbi:MAG: hypothetical protein JWP61_1576 [Friedmanniella sp.]|nr:hypothetical protein [Friedmanniella sp.]